MSTQDSQFFRTLSLVFIGLGVFFVVIVVAALVISGQSKEGDVSQDPRVQAKVDKILAPIGEVNTDPSAAAASAPAAGGAFDAEATFKSVCFACHGTGAAGAPIVGNKAAWKDRIATGMKTLYDVAIHGKGAMPPKGGTTLSDDDIKAVVDYMVSKSK